MSAENQDHDLAPDFGQEDLIEKFETTNRNITKYLKVKKFRFALSKKQREDLLSEATSGSMVHELMIYTQMHSGLRVGELVNLRVEDINFGAKLIVVNAHPRTNRVDQWIPKTQAGSRMISPPEKVFSKLGGYARGTKRKVGYFFLSQKHTSFRKETVINFIDKYARQARSIGFNIGSHALRRTFATYLIDNGAPIGKISKMLGHASIEITMKYLFQIDDMEGFSEIRKILDTMVNY